MSKNDRARYSSVLLVERNPVLDTDCAADLIAFSDAVKLDLNDLDCFWLEGCGVDFDSNGDVISTGVNSSESSEMINGWSLAQSSDAAI